MNGAAEEAQVTWQDYLAVIIRRRWYFVVPFVLIVSVTMAIGTSLPKRYRAMATLLVENPAVMNPLIEGVAVSGDVRRKMSVVHDQLLSWESLVRLADRLGLAKNVSSAGALEGLINKLRGDIKIGTEGGNLIIVEYSGTDPQLTQDIVNTVTQVYMERNLESQQAEAETAIAFIESELSVYKNRLEGSEQQLREFKELHMLEMPVASHLNQQIIGLEIQLAQLLIDNTDEHPTVVQVRRQIRELKRQRNQEVKRVLASAIARGSNPEIYMDLAAWLDVETTAEGAAQQPPTPELAAAREAYQMWVERLESQSAVNGVAVTPGARAPQAAAGVQPPAAEVVTQAAPGPPSLTLGHRQEQELARLERDYEIHKHTYEKMKERLELARITQRLGASEEGIKFRVIDAARLPLKPSSPDLLLFFFGALFAGSVMGLSAVFLVEAMDQSFQSVEDVQAALSLPVIGSISKIVTKSDVRARQARLRAWVNLQLQTERLKAGVLTPLWSHVDKTLIRWGL